MKAIGSKLRDVIVIVVVYPFAYTSVLVSGVCIVSDQAGIVCVKVVSGTKLYILLLASFVVMSSLYLLNLLNVSTDILEICPCEYLLNLYPNYHQY